MKQGFFEWTQAVFGITREAFWRLGELQRAALELKYRNKCGFHK